MNHRIVLRAAAVVAAVYGVMLVFAPNTLMSMYRTSAVEGVGMYFAMLSGAMLLGWAVMNWASSNAPAIAEIHYVLLGNLVAQGAGLLVTLFRQMTHAGAPDTGWITVGIFLVFTALFAHQYLASPAGYKLHARSRTA